MPRRHSMTPRLALAAAVLLVACAHATIASSSDRSDGAEARHDGAVIGADVGVGWNILSIPVAGFQIHASYPYVIDSLGYFHSPGASLSAPVQLPTGAAIGRIGIFVHDLSPSVNVQATLLRLTGYGIVAGCSPCGFPVPPATQSLASTASSGTPGYVYSASDVTPLHTVDNDVRQGGGQYMVFVSAPHQGGEPQLGVRGVEIWWKRQISPAPSTASFTDVLPTHLFFREIEALKAAGITLGCTATTFCPEASLTRAQMAAFLARALGLYWEH